MMALAALILVGISGCSTKYVWTHTSKDAAAFHRDKFQCEGDAATYSTNMGKSGDRKIVDQRMTECMEVQGYKKVPQDEAPKGVMAFE
jgi:hypothetical protein